MQYTLKAGRHQDTRPFSSWLHFGAKSMARRVCFDESCRYTLPAYHAADVNKLFGLSFGLFAVHQNSARFGWCWNEQDQCIDLLAYCYSNGQRNWNAQMEFPVVAQVKLGQQVYCAIEVTHEPEYGQPIYEFSVDAPDQRWRSVVVSRPEKLPAYGLTHSLYFGGALPAPHEMQISMSK